MASTLQRSTAHRSLSARFSCARLAQVLDFVEERAERWRCSEHARLLATTGGVRRDLLTGGSGGSWALGRSCVGFGP